MQIMRRSFCCYVPYSPIHVFSQETYYKFYCLPRHKLKNYLRIWVSGVSADNFLSKNAKYIKFTCKQHGIA